MESCWLYCVVSSDAQEDTLPAQQRWAREAAARLGASVERTFQGVASGRDGARTILREMIAHLEATPKSRRPSRILMTRLDRVGRLPLDAIAALNDLRRLGVTIHTRTDGDVPLARVRDQVAPILQSLTSGFENENRSDKAKSAFVRRRAEGKLVACKPPYGVTRDRKTGLAIPDPECAPIVREVFERWSAGETATTIVPWLMATAPARVGTSGAQFVQKWTPTHVYKMVRIRTYRGVVVDEDLWDRAQRRPRKQNCRPGPGGHLYLFSGIQCSCGATLRARTNTAPTHHVLKNGDRVTYPRKTTSQWYVCQSMRHADGPRYRSFREDLIEVQWAHVLRRLAKPDAPWVIEERRTHGAQRRIDAMARRLDGLDAKRARIHNAFEEGVYDASTMRDRLEAVATEEKRMRDDVAALRSASEVEAQRRIERDRIARLVRGAPDRYARATREERAAFNAAIFAAFGRPTIDDDYRLTMPAAT